MKLQKLRPMLPLAALAVAILLAGHAGAGIVPPSSEAPSSAAAASAVSDVPADSAEFRAVWVPYLSLDMQNEPQRHFGAFKAKFDAIVQRVAAAGANTIIVHVRPFGDAMYRSSYAPWSHILTGTQGQDPGYDALAYMVEASHRAGLKIHAWINPLRLRSTQTPAALSADNVASVWRSDDDPANDHWAVETSGGLFLNPAYPEVRAYLAQAVSELVSRYAVDGVHLDDYFYPTTDASFDAAEYESYCASAESPLELGEWRKAQINAMVQELYTAIHAANPDVVMGIAPQGNISNDDRIGADVATWGSTAGYVDYLCPQLYYPFDSPSQPFVQTAERWRALVTCPSVQLYGGLALYKAGDPSADSGAWMASDVIDRQRAELARIGFAGWGLYSDAYLPQ